MPIKDNFVEDLIHTMPLGTFEDVINQLKASYPILTDLANSSYAKIGSQDWRVLERLMYKLNAYMFEHSSDLQMHGNLNRICNKAMIYHVLCEHQERDYLIREYADTDDFLDHYLELIKSHSAIQILLKSGDDAALLAPAGSRYRATINPFLLANYFIEKARLITMYYCPVHIANISVIQAAGKTEEIDQLARLKLWDGLNLDEKYLHFYNETVRLTAYSRYTFALGSLIVLNKCQALNTIFINNPAHISKELIKDIFWNVNCFNELCSWLNHDSNKLNNFYNGTKQMLDALEIFLEPLFGTNMEITSQTVHCGLTDLSLKNSYKGAP